MSLYRWFMSLSIRWKLQFGFFTVTMITTIFNRILATNELAKLITIANENNVNQVIIEKLEASRNTYIFNSFWESGIEFILQFIIIGIVASFLVRPIKNLVEALKTVEQGDLTKSVENKSLDEIGMLEHSFNNMRKELNGLLGNITERSTEMGQSAYQISTISREIANVGQNEQKRSTEVNEATKELINISQSVQSLANDAANRAKQTEEHAKQGIKHVQANINIMNTTTNEVNQASHEIAELDAAAEKIHNILDTIRKIAEQTNLLSLNAAIEAARAGEQGRGFAVVADEVRNLSLGTSQSLSEISLIIDSFTQQVGSVTKIMGTVVERVNKTQETANDTANVIETMADEAVNSAAASHDIVQESQHQSEYLQNLQYTLDKLFHTLKESSSKVETTAAIGDDMNDLTERMKQLLAGFTIEPQLQSTPLQQHDKRGTPRENLNLLAKIESNGIFVEGISSNFSLTGIQLRISEELENEDDLNIKLYLPFDDINEFENQTHVSIKGKVAWSKQVTKHHSIQYVYGIQFIEITDKQNQSLEYCFDFFKKSATFTKH